MIDKLLERENIEIITKLHEAGMTFDEISSLDYWKETIDEKVYYSDIRLLSNNGHVPLKTNFGVDQYLYALRLFQHESRGETGFDGLTKLPKSVFESVLNVLIAPWMRLSEMEARQYPDELFMSKLMGESVYRKERLDDLPLILTDAWIKVFEGVDLEKCTSYANAPGTIWRNASVAKEAIRVKSLERMPPQLRSQLIEMIETLGLRDSEIMVAHYGLLDLVKPNVRNIAATFGLSTPAIGKIIRKGRAELKAEGDLKDYAFSEWYTTEQPNKFS